MSSTRSRRAAAVLLAATLLLPLSPAFAASPDRAAAEAGGAPSLFDALAAWLAALWPGPGAVSTPTAGWQAPGGELDSSGETTPRAQHVPGLDPMGEPTPQPQHGSELDPNG
jgi:hypothetical protein